MLFVRRPISLPTAEDALPGRDEPLHIENRHAVHGRAIQPPFPAGIEVAVVAMGCFWGAERVFWTQAGVWTTAVGYAGGFTKNPTYEEVCTGLTGHTEIVVVGFDPQQISFRALLGIFWEHHDPTQGMRQQADVGTQYRSAIYAQTTAQLREAQESQAQYQARLSQAGFGDITTEVRAEETLYWAEDYHQQYLHKNPNGYCGIGGTGVSCPVGLETS